MTLPYLRSKNGFSFARFSTVESLRTPSSFGYALPAASKTGTISAPRPSCGARNQPGLLRADHPRVAARGVLVHLPPGDAEPVREVLGRLAHQQADVRVGEAFHDRDHRREIGGAELRERRGLLAERLGRRRTARTTASSLRSTAAVRATARRRRPRAPGSDRPASKFAIAESSDCMPEAQLRITVQPGTFWPQPMRSATTRPMLTSSTDGAAQPRITSSSTDGSNAWRLSTRARPRSRDRWPRTGRACCAP